MAHPLYIHTSVAEEPKLDKNQYGERKRRYTFLGLTDRH
jgi:hypothetical protein